MSHFSKFNRSEFSDALIQEAHGLELLRAQIINHQIPYLRIPEIHAITSTTMMIEKIHTGPANEKQMYELGKGLALLHKIPQNQYGLNQNNYIGLSIQVNSLSDHWGEFFIQQRLGHQVGLIQDESIRAGFQSRLEKHKRPLIDFLDNNCDRPSLVHGDLWSGNVLFDHSQIWLIDPAVYYADREVDVAMTQMFAGFDEAFYQAYNEIMPLTPAYQKKRIIYNLYHYLNHYNIFGSSYLAECYSGFEFLSSF